MRFSTTRYRLKQILHPPELRRNAGSQPRDAELARPPAEVVVGHMQAHAASRFSSFFEKPSASRVNRFINVRIVRLFRSTCDVHIVLVFAVGLLLRTARRRCRPFPTACRQFGVAVILDDRAVTSRTARKPGPGFRVGGESVRANLCRGPISSCLKACASKYGVVVSGQTKPPRKVDQKSPGVVGRPLADERSREISFAPGRMHVHK